MIGILLIAATLGTNLTTNTCPIRSAADLQAFRSGEKPDQRAMDFVGHIISLGTREDTGFRTLVIEDQTGRTELVCYGNELALGDVVRFQGFARLNPRLYPWDHMEKITVLGKKPLPAPLDIPIAKLNARRDDLRRVTVEGTVVSSFDDELDARFRILIVQDGQATIPVYIEHGDHPDDLAGAGARIRLTGVFHRHINSFRIYQQPTIVCDHIELLGPPPSDPFDVPTLQYRVRYTTDEIAALGQRKISGRVLAAWDDDRLMLKIGTSDICFARLREGIALPETETSVSLVGEIDADFFNITIRNAIWKPDEACEGEATDLPTDIEPNDIFRKTATGRENINISYQGLLIRISGTLLSLPSPNRNSRQLTVNCNGYAVPVDVSALPDDIAELAVGSTLRITGRCLLESIKKTSYDIFPRITGFTIITRSPADIETLALPPWWTPGRLLGVIALLLIALISLFLRSFILKRIARLKLDERTHLAVEIHDSLSQSLTGLAFQINSAEDLLSTDAEATRGKLRTASQMLLSCRTELKNCLFDLRNDTLGEKSFNRAILKTLEPFEGSATILVRFNANRSLFDDQTVHAVLSVIRELVANAIRHGAAWTVKVAGAMEKDTLLFSVTDDGSGFEHESRKGSRDGHFGLDGVRERLSRLDGTIAFETPPSGGTRAVASIPLHGSKP